jgi:cleavage stimulation factor subunit 2
MAQSAIRNLNGFEFGGRTLRVDKASSQADELRLLHQQTTIVGAPTFETVQSANVTPDKVPEVIARTIGKIKIFIRNLFQLSFVFIVNLPPEQVVDLMKQMQNIIREYPTEARNILIQNPQLTYAMLQSLVIMGLIPPNEAVSMLHKRPDVPTINHINNSSITPANLVSNFQAALPVPNSNFQATPSLVSQPPLPIVPPPPFHQHLASMNFPMVTPTSIQQSQTNPNLTGGSPLSRTDQEKAQLLMQVLQLNEAQIAQLPADQRASIILLREQMQQSGMVPL